MDSETSTRYDADDLERMLLDGNAEPTHLPLSLLEDITSCFSDDQEIGRGGFAVVYKGMVGAGVVAVKKLSKTFGLHENKFHKEVECLMKAKHKNIVRFLGYCSDAQGRTADYEGKFVMAELRNWLLCFEYVPNGSLDKYITDASRGLEWRERYEIIKGICEGLHHLHEKRILHLDLKPSNILVDNHMVPKIADFGLSRCLDKEQTRASTLNPCGSMGYLAPESFGGKLTFASDIYSLSVIIVELLTGEKGYPEDEDVVKTWMNRLDGSDEWERQLEQVRVCIKIGIECMDSDPKKRPVTCHINDRLDKTASAVETGISSSSVEQHVCFLEEQYCQENIAKLPSEYHGKDIKEHVGKELVEYVEAPREDPWHNLSSLKHIEGVIVQGPRSSGSNTGLLYKWNNLDFFNTKARKNYVRYGGPILEKTKHVKLFKMCDLEPVLKHHNLIGKDRFGEVYLGVLDNILITVRKTMGCSMRENAQFVNEVTIQSQVIHRNIVRLIGCCVEIDSPMLVYEFPSKGSLHDILHSNYREPLNLALRLSIATESAGALAYIQSALTTKMLHTDVKPANILLDSNFVAKISDVVGMSRFVVGFYAYDELTEMVYDYMPVYLQSVLVTEKSDVYSFGVVILELLTRKNATCADNNNLVRNFVENHKQGRKSTELFDKEIAVTGDLELLNNLAEIAVDCLNLDLDLRPTMVDVAKRLSILNQSVLNQSRSQVVGVDINLSVSAVEFFALFP